MLADLNWKRAERTVAKKLGTERILKKGAKVPDVETDHFIVDVKYRKRFFIAGLYDKCRKKYQKDGKLFMLVLQQANRKGQLAVVDFDELLDLSKDEPTNNTVN